MRRKFGSNVFPTPVAAREFPALAARCKQSRRTNVVQRQHCITPLNQSAHRIRRGRRRSAKSYGGELFRTVSRVGPDGAAAGRFAGGRCRPCDRGSQGCLLRFFIVGWSCRSWDGWGCHGLLARVIGRISLRRSRIDGLWIVIRPVLEFGTTQRHRRLFRQVRSRCRADPHGTGPLLIAEHLPLTARRGEHQCNNQAPPRHTVSPLDGGTVGNSTQADFLSIRASSRSAIRCFGSIRDSALCSSRPAGSRPSPATGIVAARRLNAGGRLALPRHGPGTMHDALT